METSRSESGHMATEYTQLYKTDTYGHRNRTHGDIASSIGYIEPHRTHVDKTDTYGQNKLDIGVQIGHMSTEGLELDTGIQNGHMRSDTWRQIGHKGAGSGGRGGYRSGGVYGGILGVWGGHMTKHFSGGFGDSYIPLLYAGGVYRGVYGHTAGYTILYPISYILYLYPPIHILYPISYIYIHISISYSLFFNPYAYAYVNGWLVDDIYPVPISPRSWKKNKPKRCISCRIVDIPPCAFSALSLNPPGSFVFPILGVVCATLVRSCCGQVWGTYATSIRERAP
jgi:hypothetical protein